MTEKIPRGLIVSCQAPADSPLHAPQFIAAMASAAIARGAVGLRIDTPAHIGAVRELVGAEVPIIGLWKVALQDYSVYITPKFQQAAAIAKKGADIIAIDATQRNRPEPVAALIERIHRELAKPVMADIDTIEAAIAAANAGADLVGTTLYGYTSNTSHLSPPGFELLAAMVRELRVPAICEGGIASPAMAKKALELGAIAVVVGTDITGIDQKVEAYQKAILDSMTDCAAK